MKGTRSRDCVGTLALTCTMRRLETLSGAVEDFNTLPTSLLLANAAGAAARNTAANFILFVVVKGVVVSLWWSGLRVVAGDYCSFPFLCGAMPGVLQHDTEHPGPTPNMASGE